MAKAKQSIEDIMNEENPISEESETENEQATISDDSTEEDSNETEEDNEDSSDSCVECGSTDIITRDSGLIVCNECNHIDRRNID